MTNLDVLSGFDPLPVCVAYDIGGARVDRFPAFDLEVARPIYEELPGFTEDITDVRQIRRPAGESPRLRSVPSRDFVGVHVGLVSVGPGTRSGDHGGDGGRSTHPPGS